TASATFRRRFRCSGPFASRGWIVSECRTRSREKTNRPSKQLFSDFWSNGAQRRCLSLGAHPNRIRELGERIQRQHRRPRGRVRPEDLQWRGGCSQTPRSPPRLSRLRKVGLKPPPPAGPL